jgi:co-chaperonin GroES (HSP10)
MSAIDCNKLIPLHDGVIVTDMNFDEQVTKAGIVITSDNGKSEGIKPRWGKVYAIGPTQTDVKIGDWVLVEHGRWTRKLAIKTPGVEPFDVLRVETKSILLVSNTRPDDVYLGQSNASTTQTFDFSSPMF